MSNSQSPPELEFDQTERITSRLRDLVRNYPKGLGLVKEFLQNADDAGASKLLLIYDRRQHTGSLPNSGMNVALGPSLLFINDQTFTEVDFQRIQQIGEGGKIHDAARTGRFGQGFNTCYSVSDHPSLLTGPRIAWFDPHHSAFDKGKNAYAWLLSGAESAWPEWTKTFAPAGWMADVDSFSGTVFRLPLRSVENAEESEIIKEPFTNEDFNSILHELKQVGSALLVFLRSVISLEVREISPDGTNTLRFLISTTNESEIDDHRSVLRKAVEGNPKELLDSWLESNTPLPIVHFQHSFHIHDIDETEREETWAVTSGLFRGPENVLLNAALEVWKHQEKAIPWAGAAVCLSSPKHASGGLACFLPLPEPTGWPVWLNGWFDLSSNRRGITRAADVGETTHARHAWNQSLMKHAVGQAWALLIQKVVTQTDENLTPYTLWPRIPDKPDKVDEALLIGFYQAAANLPVVRGLNAEGHRWYRISDNVRDLSASWHSQLVTPFLAEGWTILDPALPSFVQQGFKKANQKISIITPQNLCDDLVTDDEAQDIACPLDDAPRPMLTQHDWVCAIAKFCANGDWNNLHQLPLAILTDKLLHTFTKCGTLYLVSEEEGLLLRPLPECLLESEFQQTIGLNEPAEDINLVELDLDTLIDCIPHILAKGSPDLQWLTSIFDYFTACSTQEIKLHKESLKKLELIPDQHGSWCKMGYVQTPLIPGEASKALQKALTQLSIPLLHGSIDLVLPINRFASKHSSFLWNLTPSDLADNLKAHAENATFDDAVLDDPDILHPLLNYLASTSWLKKDDARLPLLRQIRMLPSTCGRRVAADSADTYVPGGFTPPNGVGSQYLVLDTGQKDRWLELFKSLDVPTLDGSTFVEKVLLPAFLNATREQLYEFLVWLRDEFRLIERELDESQRKQLRKMIRRSPILPIEGGGLAAPWEVYKPGAEETLTLLGKRARIPDKEFFALQQDLWYEFFEEFRLPWRPLASDLLDAIRDLIDDANSSGTSAVRGPLRKLVAHIRERWADLSEIKFDGGKSVPNELVNLSWLPANSGEGVNYPASTKWPDRLWRANELVPPRLANLVASKRPILDGPEFPDAMAKSLGFITQVEASEVLEHFSAIRALPLQAEYATDVRRAATEIYRFIGQLDLPLIQLLPSLKSLKMEPCVFVSNHWRLPDRCFFEILPFPTPWAFSLMEAEIGGDQHLVHTGLERLGVRQRPDNEDWLQMLRDLAEEFDYNVLSSHALNQARHALRCLRAAAPNWLSENEILVPLIDGRLIEAQYSLIPDDPRLGRMKCSTPLPLIENNEDALDVGSRAGAKSLHGELIERLKIPPHPTKREKLHLFSIKIEQRVRSNPFLHSLRRIAYEEALGRNDMDPRSAASSPNLELSKRLKIRISPEIQVESIVKIKEKELLAFELNAASFLDSKIPCLWLKEGSNKKLGDELVRALCKLCGLTDQLRISRVLEVEPEQMSSLLDEEEVASLPEGQTLALDYGTKESEVEIEDSVYAPEPIEPDLQAELTEKFPEVDCPLEEEAFTCTPEGTTWNFDLPEPEEQQTFAVHPPSPSQSNNAEASPWSYDANENLTEEHQNRTLRIPSKGSESSSTNDRGHKPSGSRDWPSEAKSGNPLAPPTKPGQGSSTSWEEASAGNFDQSKQVRLRSYVHEREQTDYDTGDVESHAKEIGDIGEAFVVLWEKKQGRTAQLMPTNHEGYDIESSDSEGTRYIEVKSIVGFWGERGVGVTSAQYRAAIQYGPSWWLYVVEHVKEAGRSIVHTIQNPFLHATEYRFDDGWQKAPSNTAEPIPEPNSPKIGAQYEKPDGKLVRIIQTTQSGSLWRVKIEMPDGTSKMVTWNPTWRRA